MLSRHHMFFGTNNTDGSRGGGVGEHNLVMWHAASDSVVLLIFKAGGGNHRKSLVAHLAQYTDLFYRLLQPSADEVGVRAVGLDFMCTKPDMVIGGSVLKSFICEAWDGSDGGSLDIEREQQTQDVKLLLLLRVLGLLHGTTELKIHKLDHP